VEHPVVTYVDTNVVIWLAAGEIDQLSEAAKYQLEATELLMSPMVLLELEMLFDAGRLKRPASVIATDLAAKIDLRICQLPMAAITAAALNIKWTRDPGDRLIVANAMANHDAYLITKDRRIRECYASAIW
jgi:PIN domain nuclease of toxin-antitoxin system